MEETSRSEESEQTPSAVEALEGTPSEKNHAPVYEIGFHLVPTLTEDEVAQAYERITKALNKAEATVLDQESPKKISLTYRIERSVAGKREKYTEGYFGFVKFEFPEEFEVGGAVNSLEEMLRGDMQILRYLLIKTSREAPVAPRAVFSSRSLEGRTIEKRVVQTEERGEVDEGELDKSIEALVGEEEKPAE